MDIYKSMGILDERPLSQQEVKDRIQYWYSKYCNSVTVDEAKVYGDLFSAYERLDSINKKFNRYVD